MRVPLLALGALWSTPLVAQEPARVEITLSSFRYAPQEIRLKRGVPYILHFVNAGKGGHDFMAKEFFARAQVADPAAVSDGAVELEGGDSRDVRIVAPAAGRYPVHCSHFLHSTFGMKGVIVVE